MKKEYKSYLIIIVIAIILFLMTSYQIQLLQIENRSQLLLAVIILVAITINMILLSVFIYKEKNITENRLFKTIMPIILILFFILMPALKSHDELYHWFRIYDIAQGNLLTSCEYNYAFKKEGNYPVRCFSKSCVRFN